MSVRVLAYFLNSLKAYFSCLSLICLGGAPTGTLCGEPSAPLRRVQQPLLFPKNPEPELTTIHNSGAALVWNQRREVPAVHPFKTLFPKQSRSQVPGWKKHCHRLTLILNSSVEKVIGGERWVHNCCQESFVKSVTENNEARHPREREMRAANHSLHFI